MNRFSFRRMALLAAPLSLALAACGETGGEAGLSGDPIEEIAPPEGQAWSQVVEKTEDGGYRMGNPDAPIKIIEFASLTCPHCANFAAVSGEELKKDFVDSGRVSLEFRNFVTHPLDLTMAMLTRCGTEESFFALTEQVFANQAPLVEAFSESGQAAAEQAVGQSPEKRYQAIADLAGLPEFFASRGIASGQASQCLADGAAAEALVNATAAQGEEYDITGTPSFVINGQKVEVNTWPEIKAQLEKMGAR